MEVLAKQIVGRGRVTGNKESIFITFTSINRPIITSYHNFDVKHSGTIINYRMYI
jgi:hypothetical protein